MNYGTPKYDPTAERAQDLLKTLLDSDLVNREYFTRDDLIGLMTNPELSISTKVNYCCLSVRYLVAKKILKKLSHTDLCLVRSDLVDLMQSQTETVKQAEQAEQAEKAEETV